MVKRMMRGADHPFSPNIINALGIQFNIKMIDDTTEGHDHKQQNKNHIMDRNEDQ